MMHLLRSSPLVLSLLLLGACASSGGGRAGGDGPAAETKDDGTELSEAKAELRLAELQRESELAEAEAKLKFAAEDLEDARKELAAFTGAERGFEQQESQLGLDAARNRLTDAEAELGELEAMYAGDDFAEITKELVLSRGRRSLEMAQRGLALTEAKHTLLTSHTLPSKQRELEREVLEAELALAEAKRGLERTKLEVEQALAKAQKNLEKAQKGAKSEGESKE
ncbi:MAG: hypothetical protein GC161_12275 [Planctomycetaceae bacterium]|nr:hypothetical protein [Planctomycetaceae bacterium]